MILAVLVFHFTLQVQNLISAQDLTPVYFLLLKNIITHFSNKMDVYDFMFY